MDDDIVSVRQAVAARPVSYRIVMGDAKLGARFGGVLGLPLSYLIDQQGRVLARYQGEADLPAMETRIKQLLSRQTQDAMAFGLPLRPSLSTATSR
jgi:hypothetical protein